jgi:hypothetical protein
MLEAIIWGLVGAFIGWNIPQPEWAKTLTAKILSFFK